MTRETEIEPMGKGIVLRVRGSSTAWAWSDAVVYVDERR